MYMNTYFNVTFNTLKIYITLYYTYQLLNCKGHIQMTNKYNTMNVKTKNKRLKKVSTFYSIYLELYYNISHLLTIILYKIHSYDN